MKKMAIIIGAAACAFAAGAAEPAAAAVTNKIAFVNVGGAVDAALFERVVTNDLLNVISVRTMADRQEKFDLATAVAASGGGYPKGERQISVYFVDQQGFPPQLTCPGFFAVINMRGLRKDADQKTYERRVFKMVLKGLAFACGFGANQDSGRCVMGMGSFETLRGIDSTSTSYSPFCYFPLFDYLQARKLIVDEPLPEDEE